MSLLLVGFLVVPPAARSASVWEVFGVRFVCSLSLVWVIVAFLSAILLVARSPALLPCSPLRLALVAPHPLRL